MSDTKPEYETREWLTADEERELHQQEVEWVYENDICWEERND